MARYSVNNYTVDVLLADIKSGNIAIPEMQRPFVWDATQVRDLIDSLYKGFPVGYIIVWQNPSVKLKDGTVAIGKKVLIDGQQRITAMAAAIVGQEVLDSHYKWKRVCIAFNPIDEIFEVANSANQKSSKWIPDIAKVLDVSFGSFSFVMEYCQKNGIMDKAQEINDTINRLRAIQNYRTCYTDILRVAFTYKFKRGKLADLVSLLSGRDFETREFKIEIEERSFNQLHEAVLQAVNQTNYERYLMIVRSAGIVKKSLIRSQNVLNFGYALFLALRERKVDSNQIEKIVRKWLALSILTGRYSSGSPESAFDYDIKRFFAYDDPMQYLNITEAGELSEAYWKVNLVQRLNTSVASSPYFNMFLVAQVKAHDKGFLSMEIDIESMLENRGDIHHLFPKNYLIKNGIVQAQYNQIANYAFIQQEINIKIKDSSPAHYMTEVIGQCNTKKPVYGGIIEQDRLAENLKQNCIPDGFESMEIGDYQDFLQRRRELMAEKIHQYYDSL